MAVGDKLPVVMGREKAVPSGVATLGADGILAEAQRPSASQIMTADGSSVESALTVVGAPAGGIEGQALVSAGAGSPSRVKWGPWPSNPNLLDNWYFVGGGSQQGGGQFPINQRGKTQYTGGGYGIDRWIGYTGAIINLTSEGLVLSGNFFGQIQDAATRSFMHGKIVTVSALVKGGPGYIGFVNGATTAVQESEVDQVVSCTDTYYAGDNLSNRCPVLDPGTGTATVKAMKLELGPVQTLAHKDASGNWVLNDPPPDYGLELETCQRYQVIDNNENIFIGKTESTDSNLTFFIPTAMQMRANPVVSIKQLQLSTGIGIGATVWDIKASGIATPAGILLPVSLQTGSALGAHTSLFCFTSQGYSIDANL